MAILDLANPAQAGAADNQGQQVQTEAPVATSQAAAVSVPDWLNDVNESLKNDKSLHKFSGEKWKENLAKSYVELEKKLGSSVQIPKKDATEEEWGKYFSRIGRPESPDKYQVPGELPEAMRNAVVQAAFKKGATSEQLAEIVKAFQESSQAQVSEMQAGAKKAYEDAVASLKSEYGNDFDTNIELAVKALHGLFPNGASAVLEKDLGNDPRLIKDLVALGKRLGEDAIVKGESPAAKKPHPYDWMRSEFKGSD